MSNYCITIQCFSKPIETLYILESLENCININNFNVLLFVDKANKNSIFVDKNNELIHLLYIYIKEKQNIYKTISLYIADYNLGPYKACCKCIDLAFENNDYVIFSEDD